MKRILAVCAVAAVAIYAASAWSASAPTPTEKKLSKDVATLKSEVKALQAADKKQNTAITGATVAGATAVVLTGCTAAITADALQGTWQVIDQISSATQAGKSYFGPQTPITVSAGGQDICAILQLSRSQVVPPAISAFQALLAGFNGSALSYRGVILRPVR